MIKHRFTRIVVWSLITMGAVSVVAQSSPPFTQAELEGIYTASIEKRTADILEELALTDSNNVVKVHDAIMAQYRTLRARDEAIDGMLTALSRNAPGAETNRLAILPILSQTLHERFLAKLSAELTPEQVEKVKDKMTYNKVKFTFDAYCEIVPGLADKDKARILEALKAAREEAMDGGSADEKSAIFQKYKDRINAYLNAQGHNVTKALEDWEARQELAKQAKDVSAPNAP